MTSRLSETEIQSQLQALPQWERVENAICRVFRFKNFPEAVAFVAQLVDPAEAANHHPDLVINYNRVTVTLSTHDAGGLTIKDIDLARIFDTLA